MAGTPFHRCDLGMTPRYFGTVKLKVSDDAAGQFVVCLDGSDITHMQGPPYGPDFSYMVPDGAPIAARIIPMKFECLTINLAPPKFCDVTEWVPATGTIDGRQISNPDGTNPAGFNSVDLTLVFGGDCTSEDVTPAAFTVTTLPAGTAPSVTSVTLVSGTTYRANLSTTIPANKWTKICFDPSPDEDCVCIGSLPGDVQGNRAVNATADAERLRQCLDTQTCAEHQGDLNRSGAINPRDLIRLMDILNGAGNFDPNNLQTLPLSPC